MTQPPQPSPWAPPGSAWAPRQEDPPQPAESDTAVIPAVEPDTAAIQVDTRIDPSQADTAAHPHVADRTAELQAQPPQQHPAPQHPSPWQPAAGPARPAPPLGPRPPVMLNPLPVPPRPQPATAYQPPGLPQPPAPVQPPTGPPPVQPAPAPHGGPPWNTTQAPPSPWGAPHAPPPTQAPPHMAPPHMAPPPHFPQGPPPAPANLMPPPGQPATAAPPDLSPDHAVRTSKGWWRRNIWGLVALLPVLALALGPSVKDGLDLYNRVDAHEAILPGGDGWVAYADTRMRLVEFGPATDLKTYGGEPYQPPPNVKVWRAKIAIDAADEYAVAGCDLALEDTEGRKFSGNPVELSGAAARQAAGCTPEDSDVPSPWEVEIYFALPESAQPAAVRILRPTELPRYARLPVS